MVDIAKAIRHNAPSPAVQLLITVCAAFMLAAVPAILLARPVVGQEQEAPGPTPAQEDKANSAAEISSKQLKHWVAELGAPTFQRREAAVAKLLEIGAPSLLELQTARDAKDRETRHRARAIYLKILRQDYQRRISMFESGETSSAEISSWVEFSKKFGDQDANRELFATMLRSTPELMIQLEGDRKNLPKAVNDWIRQVDRSGNVFGSPVLTVGNIAALAYCSLASEENLSQANIKVFSTSRYTAKIRSEVSEGRHSATLKNILAELVGREDNEYAAALRCCLLFDLKEVGLKKARALLGNKPQGTSVTVEAMLVVARFGGDEEKKLLDGLVSRPDRYAVFTHQRKTIQSNVGDVALALLWTMEDIDPSTRGFVKGILNEANVINPHLAGFSSDEERDEAVKVWSVYKKAKAK